MLGSTQKLYRIMQSEEKKLGGGEGVEGLYGSITGRGMALIIECMKSKGGLCDKSTLVDIGAGIGRPLLHALCDPGVTRAFGIEFDAVKVMKADAFGPRVLKSMGLTSVSAPIILCASVEVIVSLDATHAYSFWEGMTVEARQAFGKLFLQCDSLQTVAIVQRSMRASAPCCIMASLGFGPLLLMDSFPVQMAGSGRSFVAYVFTKEV